MTASAEEAAAAAGLDFHELPARGVAITRMPRWVSAVLGPRAQAITLGRTVFVADDRLEDVVRGRAPELLAHELVHVRQWGRLGVARFLCVYLADYLRLRMLGLGHFDAYRHIGLEWEAYNEARRIVRAL